MRPSSRLFLCVQLQMRWCCQPQGQHALADIAKRVQELNERKTGLLLHFNNLERRLTLPDVQRNPLAAHEVSSFVESSCTMLWRHPSTYASQKHVRNSYENLVVHVPCWLWKYLMLVSTKAPLLTEGTFQSVRSGAYFVG